VVFINEIHQFQLLTARVNHPFFDKLISSSTIFFNLKTNQEMKRLYFLLIIFICFFSCQKEMSSDSRDSNTSQVDVYVAGFLSDPASSTNDE
jgi:hypothetical protein